MNYMMKSLRLLITKQCNRSCEGCCNKDWDLDALPQIDDFEGYDEIMITGGEPMLEPVITMGFICQLKREGITAPIYLYSATCKSMLMTHIVDGITLTLHDQDEADEWNQYSHIWKDTASKKSMRLNIFKGVKVDSVPFGWKIKNEMEWIKNCPLPKNEVFGQHILF